VPEIKKETSFCRRLSDVFESNPKGGNIFWRDYSADKCDSYGFSLNWFVPVYRLQPNTTYIEGELNLQTDH